MSAAPRSWDEVLAEVEADAERSAALLANATDPAAPFDGALAPAPLVLPALAEMPAVPEHLRDRVQSLRARIDELQAELAATLRDWQVPMRAPAAMTHAAAPRLLDRRI